MRFSYAKHLTGSASLSALFLLCSSLSLGAEGAAGADEDTQAVFWNFVIAVIVLATLIASAALPVAALRQWPGRWRFFAMFPLAALIFQLAVIVTGRLDDPGSHRLWPFELFAWAMANMIYICLLYTSPSPRDGLLSRMPSSA